MFAACYKPEVFFNSWKSKWSQYDKEMKGFWFESSLDSFKNVKCNGSKYKLALYYIYYVINLHYSDPNFESLVVALILLKYVLCTWS